MHSFYTKAEILAPVGTSDHKVIKWYPKNNGIARPCTNKRRRRRFPRSGYDAFGRWLISQDWPIVSPNHSTDDLASDFTSKISQGIDKFYPLSSVKLHPSDKPWMSSFFNSLIVKRQRAFHSGNIHLWRHYRDKVKLEIETRKQKFLLR